MRATDRGFTLIEVLIAVALGAVIASTAFAALRLSLQATSAATRLSIENALMRAGLLASLDDVDFWTRYDDPADATRQRLRAVQGGQGLPFTPMSQVMTYQKRADHEDDRGWDPERPWLASDPATWFRANAAERDISDQRFGRYGIFAHVEAAPGVPVTLGAYGNIVIARSWRGRQMRDLIDGIGFYGVAEYLPVNQLCAWHQTHAAGLTNAGGVPLFLIQSASAAGSADPYRFNGLDGHMRVPASLFYITGGTGFAVIAPDRAPGASVADLIREDRREFVLDYWSTSAAVSEFRARTEDVSSAALRPAHWPAVEHSVQRYVKHGRFLAVCRVRWISPVTGVHGELSFTGFGTSLRGARQQRGRDGGWASWDNKPGTINQPSLDAPPAPWLPRAHP